MLPMKKATALDEHSTPTPIRVLLADDHELVRAGFRTLLLDLGMQVIAEASNGNEALRLIQVHKPDVVLMDIAMPELNGLETTARVAQEFPNSRVIILSMHANAQYARHALRAGAAGYLLKNSKLPELEIAINAVVRGETYLTPAVASFIASGYAGKRKRESRTISPLTVRQIDILQLIAQGYSRKQIAEKLTISPKTFDTYRAQLMEQLGVHDTAGLVRYATRMGLVTPDE
jgi:DNA-binding NarL/FixJ family response regulator